MMGLTGEQEPQERQPQSDAQPAAQQLEHPVAAVKLRLAKGKLQKNNMSSRLNYSKIKVDAIKQATLHYCIIPFNILFDSSF